MQIKYNQMNKKKVNAQFIKKEIGKIDLLQQKGKHIA